MIKRAKLSETFSFQEVRNLVENNDQDGLKAAFELEGFNVNAVDFMGLTALHYAINLGRIEIVEILTSHPEFDINAKDKNSKTPLMYAAENGKIRSVELLLKKGADASITDSYRHTPLWHGAINNHFKCAEAILKSKTCLPCADEIDTLMSKQKFVDTLIKLTIESPDPYYIKNFGNVLLHYGCRKGSLEIVKFLVENGTLDINVLIRDPKYYCRQTPLQTALHGSFPEIVNYLLSKGADPAIKDSDSKSAHFYAVKYDSSETFLEKYEPEEECLEKLLKIMITFKRHKTLKLYAEKCATTQKYPNGPVILNRILSFDLKNKSHCYSSPVYKILLTHNNDKEFILQLVKDRMFIWSHYPFEMFYERYLALETDSERIKDAGQSLLKISLAEAKTSAVQYFLNRGVDPYEVISNGSYLIKACQKDDTTLVEILLKFGANVNQLDFIRLNALYHATRANNLKLVQLLLKYGADTKIKDIIGSSPLLIAAQQGYTDVFFELFKVDRDLSQRSKDGLTPFLAACHSGNTQIVMALKKAGACLTDVDNNNHSCLYIMAYLQNFQKFSCEFMASLFENLDKLDFYSMLIAVRDQRSQSLILTDKRMLADFLLAKPDITDLIGVPVPIIVRISKHESCSSCQGSLSNDDCAVVLPCNHAYHESCYNDWSKKRKTCPCCRKGTHSPNLLSDVLNFAFKKCDQNERSTKIIISHISDKNFIIQLATKAVVSWTIKCFELIYARYLELETDDAQIEETKFSLFIAALEKGKTQICNYFLSRGIDANGIVNGDSYLFLAIKKRKAELFELLLKFGADVNWRNANHQNVLHCAAKNGSMEIVRVILKHGADPQVKDKDGLTPLLTAAYNANEGAFFELFKVDRDLSQRSTEGFTPFLAACKSGSMQIVKALIEAGVCLTDVDNKNRNCFHIADALKCELILLMSRKMCEKSDLLAMMTAVDSEGHSTLDWIHDNCTRKMISDLLSAFSDLVNLIDMQKCVMIKNLSAEICLICRDDFDSDDCVTDLPCAHLFHESCFSQWSKLNSCCPYCRRPTNALKK